MLSRPNGETKIADLALVAMNQYRMIFRIEHDFENVDDDIDGDNDGWILVSRNFDPKVLDLPFSDELDVIWARSCVDKGARMCQYCSKSTDFRNGLTESTSTSETSDAQCSRDRESYFGRCRGQLPQSS